METIELSSDNTTFLLNGKPLFRKKFLHALKFHPPGLAPVSDETGWYHINNNGEPLYAERYDRAFGFYCNRAVVVKNNRWWHIQTNGNSVSESKYAWAGNYQQDLCTVRDFQNNYFHIDTSGTRIYQENYFYAGDFKEGFACIKTREGWKHINKSGQDLNGVFYNDLGVFHKSIATARDDKGWFHIAKSGEALYHQRYQSIEPFYNGFSLTGGMDGKKVIIDESGKEIMKL